MANPFEINPSVQANPLQSLMQGFSFGSTQSKEVAMRQGRMEAAQALQQGGDIRGPLAKLMEIGDVQGANTIATYANQQATQAHLAATEQQAQAQLAESGRHNRATEGIQYGQAATSALQPVKLGSDISGDIYGVRDPKSQTGYRVIDVNALRGAGQPGAAPGGAPQASAEPLTGEEFLKTLPPGIQPVIKKIANYEMDPKTSSITGGHREKVMGAVAQYDPTYDAATFPARQAAVKAFATGPQGNTLRSFDVAISHMQTGRDLVNAMDNKDYPAYNKLANIWKEQTGNPAPGNFEAAKEIIGDEIVKAVVGANSGALGDRQAIKENINKARSPQQLLGVMDTYEELMAGQVKGIKKQYEDTTQLKNFDNRLSPVTRDRLNRADHRSAAPAANAGGGDPLAQARDAISRGADRNAVLQRLQQNGINPAGL